MKKVLILSYYWPPSGGAGVQRWVRFCRSLRNYGWEPVVYTPKKPQYHVRDEKLGEQVATVRVLQTGIIEPYSFFERLFGAKKKEAHQGYSLRTKKGLFKNKIGWFIRGNLFIPDARCLWINPSIKYLKRILKKENFDVVVSTGPPHSLHLIAASLKKQCNIPWVADFRDPWISMEYYLDMPLTAMAHRMHRRLEKKCVLEPNELIVVGHTVQKEFENRYGRKATVIYNGYDDLSEQKTVTLDKQFTMVHIGTFLPSRNCQALWRVLKKLTVHDKVFKEKLLIKLIGNTHESVLQSIHESTLSRQLHILDYIPLHETQEHLLAAQVLLLPIGRADNIPGKLFEYLKARRPILLMAPPHSDAASIVTDCKAGCVVDFDDETALEKTIMTFFKKYLTSKNNTRSEHIEKFSNTHLTHKLSLVLNHAL